MSIDLADLQTRLETAVPARNDVPTSAQYAQIVEDAVMVFGRKCPQQKITTLAILSGTATYALPADFIKIVLLEGLTNPDSVIVNSSGFLVPVYETFSERYTVNNKMITFHPTPLYSMNRDLWYAAGYALVDDAYADLPADATDIVLLKAQALALQAQAVVAAREGWAYKIGDESVDKKSLGKTINDQATALNQAFDSACADYNGRSIGFRS